MNAERNARQPAVDGIVEVKDIAYHPDGKKTHLLDVYYPKGSVGKLPVLIDIHGGGFVCGAKEDNRVFDQLIALRGFVVVNINYRLIDGKHCYQDQIQDVFAACYWVWSHMDDYPADKEHIYLCGDSAGGHIAIMTANIAGNAGLMKAYEVRPLPFGQFNAIALISPTIASQSLLMYVIAPTQKELIGKNYGKKDFEVYFPDVFRPEGFPPAYVVTSNGDIIRKDGQQIASVLKKENVPVMLHDWDAKKPHVFCVAEPYHEDSVATINEIVEFLKKY